MISFSTSVRDVFVGTRAAADKRPANGSINIFKKAFSILTKEEKTRFGLLTFLDIFISVIDILLLALLLWIIQFYIQPGKEMFSFLPDWMSDKNSISLVALFFFVFSGKSLMAFFIAKAQYKFIARVAVRVSKNSLINFQQGEFEQFVNVDSSVHIRKIAHQPIEFAQYILLGIQQIFTQSFLIVIAIIAIILFNVKLFFLLLLLLLPPVIGVFYFLKRRLAHYKSQIWSSNDKSYQYLMEALRGYIEANIYNRNQFFLSRFLHHRQKFCSYHFDSMSLQTLPPRVIEIFAVFGLLILIAVAKYTGNSDSAAFLTIGAFMAAAYKIIPGIVKITNTIGQIKAYELSITGLNQIPELEQANRADVKDGILSVRFNNVNFEYGNLPVLKNFSFHFQRGDFIGITGKSGKGKTTILNLLLGFLSPSFGEILVNDKIVDKNSIKAFRPFISYVKQQTFLIHDSVRSNITLEEETCDVENLQLATHISGVADILTDPAKGIHKIITENGKNVSGGQQQRIAIARAVYNNADLILLDEPFNELDEASEHSLLDYFKQLTEKGKMIVLIAHHKKSLAYCNKIISLDEPTN